MDMTAILGRTAMAQQRPPARLTLFRLVPYIRQRPTLMCYGNVRGNSRLYCVPFHRNDRQNPMLAARGARPNGASLEVNGGGVAQLVRAAES
jgi:hypothetical protein